ncbi:MauE/DoxX family redox-associated membrane protein [Burkholderia sp. Ac-20353]|uniref:MauE/DoxX family redox-associated membrane protein n=1 Tax=Burkholderia sp. Ac-20353 TaxID=2703894 RepID=UPI00197C3C67|nr:MauE/DoxX family redox-associated membrane protein [Burkholderia sp. Ac-20353]MBN3786967.1 methylamine utilization protein MauE [Burkholderia sp. Ac-20353]
MMIDPVFATGAQASTAIVVLIGAVAKWRRPAAFRRALGDYRLLSEALTASAAFAIPAAETLGAAALLFPNTRTLGATVLVALLLAFAAGLAFNILRGHTDIDCGCSGFGATQSADQSASPRGIGWFHVARALLLAALAAVAFVEPSARQIVWFDYLTLFFAVLLIVCALLIVDVLLANMPRLSHLRNS